MSKENALRFMLIVDKDEELKNKYSSIMSKYEGKNLSEEEWDKIFQEELIPFAKTIGLDFNLEDIKELQKPAVENLADDELEQIVGGRGEFIKESLNSTYILSCELAPDDQTFTNYFNYHPVEIRGFGISNGCPNYSATGSQGGIIKLCPSCKHFHIE